MCMYFGFRYSTIINHQVLINSGLASINSGLSSFVGEDVGVLQTLSTNFQPLLPDLICNREGKLGRSINIVIELEFN